MLAKIILSSVQHLLQQFVYSYMLILYIITVLKWDGFKSQHLLPTVDNDEDEGEDGERDDDLKETVHSVENNENKEILIEGISSDVDVSGISQKTANYDDQDDDNYNKSKDKHKQKVDEHNSSDVDMTDIPSNFGNKKQCLCGEKETMEHIYNCIDNNEWW